MLECANSEAYSLCIMINSVLVLRLYHPQLGAHNEMQSLFIIMNSVPIPRLTVCIMLNCVHTMRFTVCAS